jgi:hypothetical protein
MMAGKAHQLEMSNERWGEYSQQASGDDDVRYTETGVQAWLEKMLGVGALMSRYCETC